MRLVTLGKQITVKSFIISLAGGDDYVVVGLIGLDESGSGIEVTTANTANYLSE